MTDHTSVLLSEAVDALNLHPSDIAMDCTVGAGGHSAAILHRIGLSGLLIGMDRDLDALKIAKANLGPSIDCGNFKPMHARFSQVQECAKTAGVFGKVQGILADIGVSSMHLDWAERGFSFQREGPLDMRMDQSSGPTAADLINTAEEQELLRIFTEYGEEPKARFIARAIVAQRQIKPISTTLELADLVQKNVKYPGHSRKHPATKVFQALRVEVNGEMAELTTLIDDALHCLRPGGRLAIICFHSLEDRLVKNQFIKLAARDQRSKLPRGLPLNEAQIATMVNAKAQLIKPFPITPSEAEIRENPRSRSAKLRVIEKL